MAAPQYDDGKFRTLFPEFKDTTQFPEVMIEMYWDLANTFITGSCSPCAALSGKQLDAALYMLTAHLLALGVQRQQAAEGSAQGAQTQQGGYMLSATVGEVSVSNMAPPAKDAWGFWLAQTPYGQELWALLKLLSVGGFAVGGLPERLGFRKVGGVFW